MKIKQKYTILILGVVCFHLLQCSKTTIPPQGQFSGITPNGKVKIDGTWKINHDMAEQYPGPAQNPEIQIDPSTIPKAKVTTITLECTLENLSSNPINKPEFIISLSKADQLNAKIETIQVPKVLPEKGMNSFKLNRFISMGHVDYVDLKLYRSEEKDKEKIE